MNERPGIFDLLFLPGTVAGMVLAGVLLVASDALLPDAFKILFPQKTPFFVLAIAITVASTIGFLNVAFPSQNSKQDSQDADLSRGSKNKDNFSSGGTHAL